MKVETRVIEIPVDANWNEAVLQLQKDGWSILPGAKASFPVARTVNDDGTLVAQLPSFDVLGAQVGVHLNDKTVYILRDGKLLDADGTEVTEAERLRREAEAEASRQAYAEMKLAQARGETTQ